jgi:hypothetical protein
MSAADTEIFCPTCDRMHPMYECPADPFGPPETITVRDLAVGDFVISFPATSSTRATRVNSSIREIAAPQVGRWVQRAYRQRGGTPIKSRRMAFHDRELSALDVPADHSVIVRRLGGSR